MKLNLKNLSRGVLTIGLVSALAACSQPPVPEDHYYRLNLASPTKASSGVKLNGVVEVERFIADGLLDSRPILFTVSSTSTELQSYHYNFWAQAPSIMLQNALVAKLQQSNAAKSIVTPNLRIEPDFNLAGKILRFEQITGRENKVFVSLEMSLKNTKLDQLVHLNTYSVEVPSRNASVSAAVTAFGSGVDQIIDAFMNDLRGKL